MPEISKITLPSGGTYDIKDTTAREMIAGGVSFIIAWDGTSTPVVGNIPAGVKVTYGGTTYTGTMSTSTAEAGAFYLVKSSTNPSSETLDVYDEYVPVGEEGSKVWEKIGDTQLNLTDVVTDVSLSKSTDSVLGDATTFALSSGNVTFGTPTTDTFVKSVTAETNKNLVTTTVPNVTGNTSVSIPNVTGNTSVSIPNVTSVGSASTWSFTMGTGSNAETLIISGTNSTAPTLGTNLTATNTTLGTNLSASKVTLGNAITVATGATSTTGTGDAVVTGVTVGSSGSAVTSMPTASVGTSITVGTNDKVTVLTNTTDVSVTKGNA